MRPTMLAGAACHRGVLHAGRYCERRRDVRQDVRLSGSNDPGSPSPEKRGHAFRTMDVIPVRVARIRLILPLNAGSNSRAVTGSHRMFPFHGIPFRRSRYFTHCFAFRLIFLPSMIFLGFGEHNSSGNSSIKNLEKLSFFRMVIHP